MSGLYLQNHEALQLKEV